MLYSLLVARFTTCTYQRIVFKIIRISALLRIIRVAYHHYHYFVAVVVYCISGTAAQHPLMTQALVLAQNSVMHSSQNSYRSLWNKWEIFLFKYFPPVWNDLQYRTLDYNTLLDRLLMFVTYLAHELKCNVRSIPSKMSALRHGMVSRLVKCCNAFDNDLLRSVKQGISLLPAPPHRVRLPCTLDMINYIVDNNTKHGATMSQVMLATGVYMGFFLCLRSNEYISKTVVPLIDTHQLLSTDVQFVLRDARHTLVNSNQIRHYKYTDFKTVKFSMRHAKNIRNDFGVPIWFSTNDDNHQPFPFVHLVYQWSKHSLRFDEDPFLSFRVQDRLTCLLYATIQAAVQMSADHFGLNKKSFNTHSIRMSAPTIARSAKMSVTTIMKMGRWKSLPASVLYQQQSTALNNNILTVVNNPTLFTAEDIQLSRVLASNTSSSSTVRRFN